MKVITMKAMKDHESTSVAGRIAAGRLEAGVM